MSRAGKSPLESLGMAALRSLDPETAHGLAIKALKTGVAPGVAIFTDKVLQVEVLGLSFPNSIGVAAGFDKNAEAPDAMLARGFGFVEIGAVTPRPQPGNPRPRLFRLTEDRAAINRFGFNNDGLERIAARLRRRRDRPGVVWANLGANKDSEDRAEDYVTVMRGLWGLVDAMTINISSPNTEKLRNLQGKAALDALLTRCVETRDTLIAETGTASPVLLKIAPDLTQAELADVAEVAQARGVDGIIATNTTLSRDGLQSAHASEVGGLSGAPVFQRSTEVLGQLRRLTGGAVPLVGVGGVGSAEQAYAKIRAGASLVQLYTAMIYEGPSLGARIAEDLATLLKRDGFASVADAVGADIPI